MVGMALIRQARQKAEAPEATPTEEVADPVEGVAAEDLATDAAGEVAIDGLLAFTGPMGWVLIAAGLVMVAYSAYRVGTLTSPRTDSKSPLAEWARHGYWGTDAYQGQASLVDGWGYSQTVDFAQWKTNPEAEYRVFFRLVYALNVQARWLWDGGTNPRSPRADLSAPSCGAPPPHARGVVSVIP
jgi:hypothetical protein